MFEWILRNKDWLLSGIGTLIISSLIVWLVKLLTGRRTEEKAVDKSIPGSAVIHSDRDIKDNTITIQQTSQGGTSVANLGLENRDLTKFRHFPRFPWPDPNPQYPNNHEWNNSDWITEIGNWFGQAYLNNPKEAMRELLDYVFTFINNMASRQPNLYSRVETLGEKLRSYLPEELPDQQLHHRWILELLELGIQCGTSHLFVAPYINKNDLLNSPDYSLLLLATRYLSAGDNNRARSIASKSAKGCCICSYIMGQAALKDKLYSEAKVILENADQILNEGRHSCSFRMESEICNKNLLNAETQSALGVISQKLEEHQKAEKHFRQAEESIPKVLATLDNRRSEKERSSKETIWCTYDKMPYRVIADVCFNCGCYWYKLNRFRKAEQLFEQSIEWLIRAEEKWAPPYVRLAIIKVISKPTDKAIVKESVELFIKAKLICQDTIRYRETSLSLSLCNLGLKVSEDLLSDHTTDDDPLADLEEALMAHHPLSLDPLLCHLHDARNLMIKCLKKSTKGLVNQFTEKLHRAIEEHERL